MSHPVLAGKQIIVGVCGGIAAYKACELVRLFVRAGAHPRVVMTQSATRFVAPLTFEALTNDTVYTDMWEKTTDGGIRHIDWARAADCVVIAPATANTIGKLAAGLADDPLSTLVLATTAPVVVCPSMNVAMLENPVVTANLERLSSRGFAVLASGSGHLACGETGPGRLPEPAEILDRTARILAPQDLAGKKIVVTAGPTREHLDPVRYLSNPSSGKMGYALARAAELRGGRVILVAGPTSLPDPVNVSVTHVTSALEMAEAVFANVHGADLVIKAAAVSDWRPETTAGHKVKKTATDADVHLVPNPDILFELGKNKKGTILVGFAAETQNLREYAAEKLAKKNLDMIVANLLYSEGSGFETDTNRVTLFHAGGESENLDLMTKDAVAHAVLDRVVRRFLPGRS